MAGHDCGHEAVGGGMEEVDDVLRGAVQVVVRSADKALVKAWSP